MTMLPPSTSRAIATQAVVSTALTMAHSLRTRGLRRSLVFAALGIGLPVLGEYTSINVVGMLRHRTEPQLKGVPLGAALGWYNIGYATFATVESLLAAYNLSPRTRLWALPVGTALTATSLDLLMDCFGLDQGMWEWNVDGPYASEIVSSNGHHGIPIDNFTGWIVLTSGVTLLYLWLAGDSATELQPGKAGSVWSGRTAAILLLPYYLGAFTWAIKQRKFRYILFSILAPIVIVRALWGE